jgi:hypothetical protein
MSTLARAGLIDDHCVESLRQVLGIDRRAGIAGALHELGVRPAARKMMLDERSVARIVPDVEHTHLSISEAT